MKVKAIYGTEGMTGESPVIPAGILCDCVNMASYLRSSTLIADGCRIEVFVTGTDSLGMNPCARAIKRCGNVPYSMRDIFDFRAQSSGIFARPEDIQIVPEPPSGDALIAFNARDVGDVMGLMTPAARSLLSEFGSDWDLIAIPLTIVPFWAIRWEEICRPVVFADPTPAMLGMFPLFPDSPEWRERMNEILGLAGLSGRLAPCGSYNGTGFELLRPGLRYAILIAALAAAASTLESSTLLIEYPQLADHSRRLIRSIEQTCCNVNVILAR